MPRPSSPRNVPVPEAELEVLSHLSQLGQAEVTELRSRMQRMRKLSHASIVTLLQRLQRRGLVDRRKADVGKAFVYFPTTRADAAFGQASRRLLTRIFHNDSVSLISSLFGSSHPGAGELQRLRQLVDELEETSHRGDPRD